MFVGCGISVRIMEVIKGLYSFDEENVYIGVYRN